MAAELEQLRKQVSQLAEQFRKANQPDLANILDADALGFDAKSKMARQLGIETFAVQKTTFEAEKPSVERLMLPSKEQLVVAARTDVACSFGKDYDIPEPPDDLFHDLEKLRQVRKFEISYQPPILFDPEAELDSKRAPALPIWRKGVGVKPEPYFWQLIKEGTLSPASAVLPEGWVLRDGRAKPQYQDGKQYYEDDAFLQASIHELRASGEISKYGYVPNDSRFGISPIEIEQVIIPHFATLTGVKGLVEYPTELEFNTAGNRMHPEWGKTDTLEWLADKAFEGRSRLVGGVSGNGGLAYVGGWQSVYRDGGVGFRLQVRYPSQKPT